MKVEKGIIVCIVKVSDYAGYDDLQEISNLKFLNIAEQQGNVWTLAKFREAWDKNDVFIPSVESFYIRFMEVKRIGKLTTIIKSI